MATVSTSHLLSVAFAAASATATIHLRGASIIQGYDSETATFEPNRAVTPTWLVPHLTASAPDGSLSLDSDSTPLGEVKWYVNGTLASLSAWVADKDFTILDAADGDIPKGSLKLMKNFSTESAFTVRCCITVADPRGLGNITAWSDPVTVRSTVRSKTPYALHTDLPTGFLYDAVADPLDLLEYKWEKGIVTKPAADTANAQRAALLGRAEAYERTYEVRLMKGGEKVPASGYNVRVDKLSSPTNGISPVTRIWDTYSADSKTPAVGSAERNLIPSATVDAVKIDARYVASVAYIRVTAYWGGAFSSANSKSFSIEVRRVTPTLEYKIVNKAHVGLAPGGALISSRKQEVEVWRGPKRVECPERVLDLTWKGRKAGTTNALATLGTGATPTLDLTKVVGYTAANVKSKAITGIELVLEATLKGAKT